MKTRSHKKMMYLKQGDQVRITKSNSDCFRIGEIAELTRQDEDGDWWGMFDTGMVEWCITQEGSCEPLDSNPTIADSAIYQHTAQLAEKYKAQRDELLTALRPFSKLLKDHHAGLSDGHPIYGISDSLIDAGDLRRAVKAIFDVEQSL